MVLVGSYLLSESFFLKEKSSIHAIVGCGPMSQSKKKEDEEKKQENRVGREETNKPLNHMKINTKYLIICV